MGKTTVWILGDQLLEKHPAPAQAADKESTRILLIESAARARKLPYQRKKLVLLFSAMRHYAQALRDAGYDVDYVQAEDFAAGLAQHVAQYRPGRLLTMAASSYQGRRFQAGLEARLGLPVTVLPNTQFLIGRYNPIPDPEAEKRYVMENFYRAMRRHFDLLMEGDEPAGGRWNFDAENRKKLPADKEPPPPLTFAPDAITEAVMAEVAAMPGGVGTAEGFAYGVTRADALAALDDFVAQRLAEFGDYEDALTRRSHVVYHSQLSPYLNLGLLEPLETARAAAAAFEAGRAPLNAVEGFVRQIIGWREFMAWQYWRQMPGMLQQNAWGAERPLPGLVWTGETEMACLRFAVERALDTGYNHHIERLMLLSNFFMLCGVNPRLVNDWFSALYIDAADWVMPPNVIGMGLNADDGLTATKPYIAGANYINKMGDHCGGCRYDPKQRLGRDACPFNALYWHFVLAHEERLRANPRTSRAVWGLRHLDTAERQGVRRQAQAFIASLYEA
jgi:(6-4)DNA photolyase